MKKDKKIKNKVTYEENPWADDPPGALLPVKNFLPSPDILKHAEVRIFDSEEGDIDTLLSPKDAKSLRKQAEKFGLSPRALVIGLVHDYLRGKLVRVDK